jgi:hypothetical protein
MKHTVSITVFALLSLSNFNLQSTRPYRQKKVTDFFSSRSHKATKRRKSELKKLREAVMAIKAQQKHRKMCAKAAEETNSNCRITWK